jgi:hypothetical protein
MTQQKIKSILRTLTNHDYIELTQRGNASIKVALSNVEGKVLIPEEGGWLSYKTLPKTLGLEIEEVKCHDSKIDLNDLRIKSKECSVFLYQNPGGYFAEEPIKEIYEICKSNSCLVIMDVSGSIGTELCNGKQADILVCSFGRWKLVDAGIGGFVSARNDEIWQKIKPSQFDDEIALLKILHKLEDLPNRIGKLELARETILDDLKTFNVVYPQDTGFVVVVKYSNNHERGDLVNYCKDNDLDFTEGPRYIRINKEAISIEVKRL